MSIPDIVTWAQSKAGFYIPETKQPIRLAPHQVAILRHILTLGSDGRLPYSEVVLSSPKKSGKTTIGSLVMEYFGLFIEAPNEIYSVANDLEQATSRAFKALAQSVRLNPHLQNRADVFQRGIVFDNGTELTALASDYASAAGSNHGLSVFDELWAYFSERSRRLWDELTPPPTRRLAMRLVVTYAGYSKESELLEGLYNKGQAGEVVPELAHILNGEGQPTCRRNGKTFVYWDHELKPYPGLTISPADYHAEQRAQLRPLAYLRLHENRFTSNESIFIASERWEACYSPDVCPLTPDDDRYLVLGADASTSRDCTALVGVVYNEKTNTTDVVYCRVWKPSVNDLVGKAVIDLDKTIKAEILRLAHSYHVAGVRYDPWQLHSIAMELREADINMIEMPQTAQRVEADQALYDAIIGRSIRHFNHPDLNEHITNAVAVETARGFRLAKEKASFKIDAAVALSMAHSSAKALGWQSQHFW
jgi:phage terminase large subunit-like protein